MKPNKIAFYLLPMIFIPIIAIFLWKAYLEYQPHGLSDIGQAQDYPYSRYSNGNGKVYYLKVGLGYFPVDRADAATFQALNTVNDRGAIGKDAKHVFYKTAIIPGVNPADVVYLGNNYFKAGRGVYYGNTVLKGVDAASFKFIKGYYSRDYNQVFFKQKPVPGADVKTLDSVKNNQLPYEYVADQHRVYYNGEVIDGAQAGNFIMLDVAEDQWNTQYAFDGKNYFFEKYQILVGHDARKTHLKLITLDKGFG